MEAVAMKQLSIAFIVWLLSVMSGNALGHVLPNYSDVQIKSDGNIIELYKDSGDGSSWLQMVLVFSRHSSNSQPKIVIKDKPCSRSDEVTTKCPEVNTKCKECLGKDGFVQLESNIFYFFSTKEETWHNALKSCQVMGTSKFFPW